MVVASSLCYAIASRMSTYMFIMAAIPIAIDAFVMSRGVVGAYNVKMSLSGHEDLLVQTAATLLTPGKGILAADESIKTIGKRFQAVGVENTLENRKFYRNLLFTTPLLESYISGTIMHDETVFQSGSDNGQLFVEMLNEKNILVGVKVDTGLQPLAGANSWETCCTGLDGLQERAALYFQHGVRFAKWRAVLYISASSPSPLALRENAWTLARYARIMQDYGIVPVIEPEVLMEGQHTIYQAAEVQEVVLSAVYQALHEHRVFLEGSILKPSMTCPGSQCTQQATMEQVAEYTMRTLERTVPCAVPGIAFLSGGLREEQASGYLNAINQQQQQQQRSRRAPWTMTFSFGRGLQQSCLKVWRGRVENEAAAQAALLARARANSAASLGVYLSGSQPSV